MFFDLGHCFKRYPVRLSIVSHIFFDGVIFWQWLENTKNQAAQRLEGICVSTVAETYAEQTHNANGNNFRIDTLMHRGTMPSESIEEEDSFDDRPAIASFGTSSHYGRPSVFYTITSSH